MIEMSTIKTCVLMTLYEFANTLQAGEFNYWLHEMEMIF